MKTTLALVSLLVIGCGSEADVLDEPEMAAEHIGQPSDEMGAEQTEASLDDIADQGVLDAAADDRDEPSRGRDEQPEQRW